MPLNLYYRANATNPPKPSQIVVKASPLTILEIDANFKTISDAFDDNDVSLSDIHSELDSKAPINRPEFTGYIRLPNVTQGNYPSNPSVGTVVYDRTNGSLAIYNGTQWALLSVFDADANNLYVKRTGDIMTGKLTGTTSEWTSNIKALPPEAPTDSATDVVATVEWVKNKALEIVNDRLNGGTGSGDGITVSSGDITVNQGDVIIDRGDLIVSYGTIKGNLDMGVLS